MIEAHGNELILVGISIGTLLIYHTALFRKVRAKPMETSIGMTDHARGVWVQSVMGGQKDLLAIQTLRNWVMASTFLASTSVLISLGLLASAFRTDIAAATETLNIFGHTGKTLWMLKLLLLAALFFSAFFNFTLAIRYYNHAGLLINIPPGTEPSATIDCVTAILNHGALHYTFGMRGFYLSIPLGLWLFGPSWMLGGSVVLVVVLYRIDREI